MSANQLRIYVAGMAYAGFGAGRPSKRERLAAPAHSVVRVGTLNSILRSVSAHKNVSGGRS